MNASRSATGGVVRRLVGLLLVASSFTLLSSKVALAAPWTDTGPLNTARWGTSMTTLPDGKVLAAGGTTGSFYLSTAELYDPATGTWASTGAMSGPRALAQSNTVLLQNG